MQMAKDQTEMAFMENADETIDPVSGNDVPPGSLPEEVRDDIDAKLSEGEYVVPADVVRYYGVKFFENLRTKAKQGLQQMDEDGRIGGEPTSEMFLPFDVSELEVEDENGVRMAVGGLVPGYYVGGGVGSSFGGGYGYGDPFKTPTVVKPPEPVAPVTPGVPSTGSYVRTYYDRYGNPVSIMFINGQPQQSLEGLTTSNPDRTDTVQENQRFEGAKLNDLGQPIDKDGNIITASSSGGFNLPSFGFGTSAAEEFDYAKTLADETDLDRYKKIGAYASGELAKNKPSLLGRIGQALIGVGVGTIAGPAAGLIAGQAYGINKNQQNIADAQLSLKVLESQYTGKDINATGATVGYKSDPPESKNAAIKSAYDALKEELENIADQNPSFFKQAMGLTAPDIDARFKKLGLNQKAITADAIIAENQQGVKSAAELAQDARLGLAKTKWAGQPKKNVSWNQTGPTNETYEKYVNIGRQSERITARGQVMRTQADAYNQNRADDQAAGAKRAGERAAARRAANSRDGYTDKQGKTHRTGQDAVDAFNRDNADDIRTKYGGNKQTDSNGENSGCFLTTAIVEHRGESDDGPTLTKLRHFRDTYLVDYPEEIKKYYNIAPKIVAAIPKNNPEWDWVGTQIDSAIQDIDNNMPDKAHKTYKNMVLKLETNWLN
jgi:Arc/MetJ-type ribon-helix-helix transcriptional regulator